MIGYSSKSTTGVCHAGTVTAALHGGKSLPPWFWG
jgi:hypothetical protein